MTRNLRTLLPAAALFILACAAGGFAGPLDAPAAEPDADLLAPEAREAPPAQYVPQNVDAVGASAIASRADTWLAAKVAELDDGLALESAVASSTSRAKAPLTLGRGLRFASRAGVDFEQYFDYAGLTEALVGLAERYAELCALSSMGRSREGRELWVMTLTNPATGAAASKPAMYIDGNTHGNEIDASEVALYSIAALCEGFGNDDFLTWLLDAHTFYIAPTVNPDGREYFMNGSCTPHASRRNARPTDNDRDGRVDEDPPNDLDGDGSIVQMRRVNPDGGWRLSRDDPRSMERMPRETRAFGIPMLGPVRDGDGEQRYDYWFSEGVDDDGDGRINEDDKGGVDLNRNFPTFWAPAHVQSGAGPYPLSEPETRGTVEFIRARPNIAAIQSYHNIGAMILRGPGIADRERQLSRGDRAVFDAIARSGEGIIEQGYRYLVVHADLYNVRGGFLDWGYFGLGVISYSNELWAMPFDYDKDGRVSSAERLRWNDEALHGAGYVDWHEVEHPTLGTVELGGWAKLSMRNPPTWMVPEMCHRNFLFTMHHAAAMPALETPAIEVSRVEGAARTWRVSATFRNNGLIPTITERGRAIHATRPDVAEVTGPSVTALAVGVQSGQDGATQSLRMIPAEGFDASTYAANAAAAAGATGDDIDAGEDDHSHGAGAATAEGRDSDDDGHTDGDLAATTPVRARYPAAVEVGRLGSHGETTIEWLIQADAGSDITVTYTSVIAGRASATVTLDD